MELCVRGQDAENPAQEENPDPRQEQDRGRRLE
ncbi:unannotated protein [freshwater metagenome]|uniref:Unannotated protein n=1 Tax=freshwater metagenome TaxID=449393 RepID=A0A6J7KCB3_9ZZZZ